MTEYDAMTRSEVEAVLRILRSRYEDLEETINFNLTYSAAHIGGSEVRRDEESLCELQKEIRRVEALLTKIKD